MRLTSFLIIGAAALSAVAHAQPTLNNPEAEAAVPPPIEQVPPSLAQPGALPGADGVVRQWGPQAPIVQAAPPAAQSYPPCTQGRTDSCYNPDPSREADTKAAWKSEG